MTARDFERVDLSQYKWIHWEVSPGPGKEPGAESRVEGTPPGAGRGGPPGQRAPVPGGVWPQARNAAEQAAMMRRVEQHNRARPAAERVGTSVELEKPREELLPLMALGRVVRGGATAGRAQGQGQGLTGATGHGRHRGSVP